MDALNQWFSMFFQSSTLTKARFNLFSLLKIFYVRAFLFVFWEIDIYDVVTVDLSPKTTVGTLLYRERAFFIIVLSLNFQICIQ